MKGCRRIAVLGLLLGPALVGCGTPERPHNIRSVASYYHVRPGDTLYTIAWRYNLDVRDLMGWNGLKPPYTIYPGQRLRLSPPPGYRPMVVARRPAPVAQRPPATQQGRPTAPQPPPRKATNPATPTTSRPPAASPPQPATKLARPAEPEPPPKAPPKAPPKPTRPVAAKRLAWGWPLDGKVVQRFNPSLPGHQGIRIRGHTGEAVRAVEAGRVVYSGNGLKGYRELIIIQHSPDYLSAYARNRRRLVAEGDVVRRGEKIAELGDPHTNAPELHFELRYRGKPVDPLRFLHSR